MPRNLTLYAAFGLAVVGVPGLAAAQEVPAGDTAAIEASPDTGETLPKQSVQLSGEIGVVSEYRFRGVARSGGDPAVQGNLDLVHSSGFYLGTWISSVDERTFGHGDWELDAYAGWTGPVGSASLDVGAIAYTFPDAGAGDFDYYEGYASLSYTLGPARATGGAAYAPEQDGLGGRDNLYLFGELEGGLPGTPVTLKAHLGYTDGALTYTGDGTAFDWLVGAEYALWGPLTASLSYVGAQGRAPAGSFNPAGDTVVVGLRAAF